MRQEWLETDGCGGFASGTVDLVRTRRYHALLMRAVGSPSNRYILVNGADCTVVSPAGRFAISAQNFQPGVVTPDGATRVAGFTAEPWPTWEFTLPEGRRVRQEISVGRDPAATIVTWTLIGSPDDISLEVRLFFSGRSPHALHHENPDFQFSPRSPGDNILEWRPYGGAVPPVTLKSNAVYAHAPEWFRNFLYEEETARGLDDTEDLAGPGVLTWKFQDGPAVLVLGSWAEDAVPVEFTALAPAALVEKWRAGERARRAAFATPLHRSADDYIVRRGAGHTIIAGYPWFTDWGRDTFISMRGLGVAIGRLDLARSILLAWAGVVSEGMLPNFFPEGAAQPEYNSVDASLWFIIAVHDYLAAGLAAGQPADNEELSRLLFAVEAIVHGYAKGTRYNIHADDDGLLCAGQPGVQVTWMDAKVGDWVVTPRIGKPVEVQALWINALNFATRFTPSWSPLAQLALKSFRRKFWNAEAGCLYDVVDADFVSGRLDASIRPNQIFAVGGLPFPVLSGERAASVVRVVEEKLLTPLGLRSLDPSDASYKPYYRGGVLERDGAYHQGTVWPWLIGPFVEAWLRVQDGSPERQLEARSRFLEPLHRHLKVAGLGHVTEVADGAAPHRPGGCPFQAWSLGELLRLEYNVMKR